MNMMNRPPPRSPAQIVNARNASAPTRPGPTAVVGQGGVPVTRPVQPQGPIKAPARPTANGGFRPGAPAPLNAKTLSAKADELFMVMRQLCELLTKENAALKRYRADEVKALSERKEQLANLYQAHLATVSRDQTALKGLDTAKRTTLMQMASRLAELMRDNASMLRAHITSIDTFFQAVTDAVRERQEKKSASYSRGGVLNGYTAVKRNLAVSYNTTT
jgi:hypothetical protein